MVSIDAAHVSVRVRQAIPDLLRGLAIVAMLVAHGVPLIPDMPWAVAFLSGNINDLASPLFALVMGMSAQLVWKRSARVPINLVQQAIRGIILIALGIWMATWGSWVAIVLQPLGLLLIVGVPLLLLGSRMVAATAVLVLLVSQPVVSAAREGAWWFVMQGPAVGALADWTINGAHYRLMNLLPFFLLGGLLIRRGLKRDRVMWAMAVIAPIAYLPAAGVNARDLGRVMTGDYLDTLHDVGLVFATYVVVVLVSTSNLREPGARVRDAVLTPFRALGQLALSLYLLHVGVIALWSRAYGWPDHNNYVGWLLIVPGMCLVAWLWWRYVGTGPVEWVMGFVTGRRKPLLTASSRPSARQAVNEPVDLL
ncbi:uncharacterized protein QF046_001425 [Microbacterium sp. W4I4]|uniref:DUF418 domain-containing protein n=1 Tax=Microbacterium sp. W4I4 TaxID=3042295 RepID=UPI00278AB761|nr:DUF418 domain-containing protein [Microbacterium sp. W4I4]MDQ0613784.1 uncharacterized protein [Microbacterium sp. W4I4]